MNYSLNGRRQWHCLAVKKLSTLLRGIIYWFLLSECQNISIKNLIKLDLVCIQILNI